MERHKRFLAALATLFVFVSVLSFLSLSSGGDGLLNPPRFRDAGGHRKSSFKAPKRNVWAELSQEEADDVYEFLLGQWADLNVTRSPKSTLDSFIYTLEALQPNKTDVLPYLHHDGSKPQRWAKVVLSRHVDDASLLAYYAVGPLPVSGKPR